MRKKTRIWSVKYDAAVKVVLEQVWQIANRICGKRLVPLLKELIPALEKFGHLEMEPEVREKVLALSPATADRLLRKIRKKEKRSKGTTRNRKKFCGVCSFGIRGSSPTSKFGHCNGECEIGG